VSAAHSVHYITITHGRLEPDRVGIIGICVVESLSELTQLFPAPNAIVEYVRAFIDEDLGWVIGIAYW
jgi:amino acid permease